MRQVGSSSCNNANSSPSAEVQGRIQIPGCDLSGLSEAEMEQIRGSRIGILFQSPDRSLNPLYRISRQILEPLHAHQIPGDTATSRSLLQDAGFACPDDVLWKYPCQCSGGMNQRSLLAMVSSLQPEILIADEPTKGLDADRVADVSEMLRRYSSLNRGIMLITHDISLAAGLADRIMVMYAGEVVESGGARAVLDTPSHPYTRALLASLPEHGFVPIPGMSPSPLNLPSGCRFSPRCRYADEACYLHHPALISSEDKEVRCQKSC
jgi:peptide/nickel transport system ATP-binding protein